MVPGYAFFVAKKQFNSQKGHKFPNFLLAGIVIVQVAGVEYGKQQINAKVNVSCSQKKGEQCYEEAYILDKENGKWKQQVLHQLLPELPIF